tara:strand:- start:1521 stop:1724 length:204 start_codon:yes stop_codon:yes gene_type:complete
MKKLLLIIALGLLIVSCSESQTPEEKAAIERLNKASQSQKACVETLGEGVYSYKSLSWKLDNCNVPK